MRERFRVLVAGIGGASLGTEVVKSLRLADRYTIFGCDISPLAFGHYGDGLEKSYLVGVTDYVGSVIDVCRAAQVDCVIPGGEEPLVLLGNEADRLREAGVTLAANAPAVVRRFTDKHATFAALAEAGFAIPKTWSIESSAQMREVPCPCIIKPAVGSGGSSFVFLASDHDEAALYVNYLTRNGKRAVVQEYIVEAEGEFTVGVLSLPDGRLVGSIAMRRLFHNKLSVLLKAKAGLISTGNSQGLIDDFPGVRATAEAIARKIGSEGPLNVQGRVRDGVFYPFEINPRFSASTYLRALAGFNEIDLYLRHLAGDPVEAPAAIRAGYYLRSFTEVAVPKVGVMS